jgi:hypothetical protein
MARLHCLLAWSVALAFVAAAALGAAEPKKGQTKASAEKPKLQQSSDRFADVAKPAKQFAKKSQQPAANEMRPGVGEAAIEKALSQPTEMDFTETPLSDVLNYLQQCHHIAIKIDNKALSDAGIGADSPVTVSIKGTSLRSALNLMLRELSLTWMIRDEALMITTPEEAENNLITKVYDVADLVTCRDEHDAPWEDYDTLIDIIASTIKPTTWDVVGGAGSINGATLGTAKVLVASQTREVQEQIADLLAKIRAIAKMNPNAGVPRRNRPLAEKTRGAQSKAVCEGFPANPSTPAGTAPKASEKPAEPPAQPKESKQPKAPKQPKEPKPPKYAPPRSLPVVG